MQRSRPTYYLSDDPVPPQKKSSFFKLSWCFLFLFSLTALVIAIAAFVRAEDSSSNNSNRENVQRIGMLENQVQLLQSQLDLITAATATIPNNNGTLIWARLLGGSSTEEGKGIATDALGNVYITGFSNSDVVGRNVMITAKYASNGTQLWLQRLGGTGDERGNSIAADSAGNAYVTGYWTSPSLLGSTNAGGSDLVVAKYASNGTLLWARLLGGPYDDLGARITTDSAGNNIYIVGIATNCSFGGSTTIAESQDILVVKYSSEGTLLWVRLLGGNDTDDGRGVAVDFNGNVYVAGFSESYSIGGSGPNAGPTGADDVVTAKYASDGTLLWVQLLGGFGNDQGRDITVDTAGNVYVVASAASSVIGGVTSANPSDYDFALVKYASNGTLVWLQMLGGSGADRPLGVTTDTAGNIYMTGQTSSSSMGGSNSNAGNFDIVVAKYASNSSLLWVKLLGSSGIEFGYDVASDRAGNIYVIGNTNSISIGGSNSNAGHDDMVIFRLS